MTDSRFISAPLMLILLLPVLGLAFSGVAEERRQSQAHARKASASNLHPGAMHPIVKTVQTEASCWVHIKWDSAWSELDTYESKVRTRGGYWVNLHKGIGALRDPGSIPNYDGHLGRSVNIELRRNCDRLRRYKFKIRGALTNHLNEEQRNPYYAVERWFYYPSGTVEVPGTGGTHRRRYTKNTKLDLGWIDHCLFDPDECGGKQ